MYVQGHDGPNIHPIILDTNRSKTKGGKDPNIHYMSSVPVNRKYTSAIPMMIISSPPPSNHKNQLQLRKTYPPGRGSLERGELVRNGKDLLQEEGHGREVHSLGKEKLTCI